MIFIGAIGVTRQFYSETSLDVFLSGVNCFGKEKQLVECSFIRRPLAQCTSELNDAGIVCQDVSTQYEDCVDGSVRLVNGTNPLEGRVELCVNNAWGTICDSEFSEDLADIICNQTGFKYNGRIHIDSIICMLEVLFKTMYTGTEVFRGATKFGQGSGPIYLEKFNEFNCRLEDSTTIVQCSRNPVGIHECDHSQDAGVRCIGKSLLTLV